jgi:pilus assembly protein CpaC
VPWLGQVPFLGALFSTKAASEEEKELVVMVTPHLVDAQSACQVAKVLPGQESRTPDNFELFLEGILEAPRGTRKVFHGNRYVPAHLNGPTANLFPCGGQDDGIHTQRIGHKAGCAAGQGCNPGEAGTTPAGMTPAGAAPDLLPLPTAPGGEARRRPPGLPRKEILVPQTAPPPRPPGGQPFGADAGGSTGGRPGDPPGRPGRAPGGGRDPGPRRELMERFRVLLLGPRGRRGGEMQPAPGSGRGLRQSVVG